MPASLLVAAPDSALKIRQAADVVLSSSTPHDAQLNAAAIAAHGTIGLAAGTYKPAAPLVRLSGLEWVGEGEDTCITPHASWNGAPGLFSTAPAAHYTRIAHMRIDAAGRAASAAYAASGKPDAAPPPTSPDSWHRHDHLIVHGHTGSAFASTSGTEYTREGWIVNCLVIGDLAWSGSDLYVDGLEIRNARNPVVLGGGNLRGGVVKVFYSDAPVAVRISSSRLVLGVLEVQDAGYHGLDVASADCLIAALRIDSAGRSGPNGDALLLNASGALLPAVQILDRGANAPNRTRNGVVANAAGGCVIDAQIGNGLSGAAYTGPAINAMSGLRINGRQIVPASTTVSANLTALVNRIAALEMAGANLDTSISAIDESIAAIEARCADAEERLAVAEPLLAAAARAEELAALALRVAALEQHDQAAAATLPTLDAAIAKIGGNAPYMRLAMEQARGTIAKSVGA